MKQKGNNEVYWTTCQECNGQGKKRRKLRKKVRFRYQQECDIFEKNNGSGLAPIRPMGHLSSCVNCGGTGLVCSIDNPKADNENYPHVAIIGGGIGGMALAVACMHRRIPFTLYERDSSFESRSQGYGLTLQQGRKAIEGLGIFPLKEALISTRHIVHTTEGIVIGEWGMRKWMIDSKIPPKRTNMHIARQSLRMALLQQLGGKDKVQWGHQLVSFIDGKGEGVELNFQVDGGVKSAKADFIVGADGIRSTVRKLLMGEDITPLRYLGCIVILGICPLVALQDVDSSLLDSATIFQTANGNERIYIMPFTSDSVMWQLSFPMQEDEAKVLSEQGAEALKKEACRRTQWHHPIPQILSATKESQVSGYSVYDRDLLEPELMKNWGKVTLIGDAAHPMSPFKGQGANQALLDALSLARGIARGCRPLSQWKKAGVRKSVLTEFEIEMLERSASKVKGSAEAAYFLHTENVLHKSDEPRGRFLKRKDT